MAEQGNEEEKDDEGGGGLVPPVSTLVAPCLVCLGQEHNLTLKATLTGCIGANIGPIKPVIDIMGDLTPPNIAKLPGQILQTFLQNYDKLLQKYYKRFLYYFERLI